MKWYGIAVNPEPWAIGPVGYSRRGGKMSAYVGRNAQLDAYKEAVKEAMQDLSPVMVDGEVSLTFYFWRNRAEYLTPQARTHRKHQADLTNLQKATEDALQEVLFANDRDVRQCFSQIREQGPDVLPRIIIGIQPYEEFPLPVEVLQILDGIEEAEAPSDNVWRGPNG